MVPKRAPKISRKAITKCPHTTEPFYAKGMCEKCYHKGGRGRLAD